MFLFWLFFSFRGRIARFEFIPAYVIASLIPVSIGFNAGFHGRALDPVAYIPIIIAGTSELALKFKRSHDLGLSGFWFIPASPLGLFLLLKGLALGHLGFMIGGLVQVVLFIRLLYESERFNNEADLNIKDPSATRVSLERSDYFAQMRRKEEAELLARDRAENEGDK